MSAVLGLALFFSVEALKFCKTVCCNCVDHVHKYCLRSLYKLGRRRSLYIVCADAYSHHVIQKCESFALVASDLKCLL